MLPWQQRVYYYPKWHFCTCGIPFSKCDLQIPYLCVQAWPIKFIFSSINKWIPNSHRCFFFPAKNWNKTFRWATLHTLCFCPVIYGYMLLIGHLLLFPVCFLLVESNNCVTLIWLAVKSSLSRSVQRYKTHVVSLNSCFLISSKLVT